MELKEFTEKDCARSMFDDLPDGEIDNCGKVCVIPLSELTEEYRKPEFQLFRVSGGFGSRPHTIGRTCFGHFCFDGEKTRWFREDFIGVGNAEVEKIAQEFESAWQGKKKTDEMEM